MRVLTILFVLLVNWAIGQPGVLVRLSDSSPIPELTATEQEVRQLSFEMVKGIIFVEAVLNGKTGNYILDTGAPELIVNASGIRSVSFLATGISGRIPARWLKVKLFEWAGTQNWKMKAIALDLTHLEFITDREIAGIIGYSLLKDYELFMDYENSQIKIIKSKNNLFRRQQPLAAIPFQLRGHLPVIKVMIGDRKLLLGLDTGASTNLISKKKQKKIKSSCKLPFGNGKLVGLSKKSQSFSAVQIRCMKIEGLDYYNMKFIFADISHFNQALNHGKIDGLLGYPFFNSGKFSFDYQNKMLYVWEMPHSNFLVKLD